MGSKKYFFIISFLTLTLSACGESPKIDLGPKNITPDFFSKVSGDYEGSRNMRLAVAKDKSDLTLQVPEGGMTYPQVEKVSACLPNEPHCYCREQGDCGRVTEKAIAPCELSAHGFISSVTSGLLGQNLNWSIDKSDLRYSDPKVEQAKPATCLGCGTPVEQAKRACLQLGHNYEIGARNDSVSYDVSTLTIPTHLGWDTFNKLKE